MAHWINFSFGEDIRRGLRETQELDWSNAKVDGRAHISNRETVIQYRKAALNGIHCYYSVFELLRALYPRITPFIVSIIASYAYHGHEEIIFAILDRQDNMRQVNRRFTSLSSSLFQIYARKRPLQQFELEIGCYDACNAVPDLRAVILHDCKLARNGRQLNMTHKIYSYDLVFNDYASNQQVCEATIDPLLRWVRHGKDATYLCFGQTGTGKTYTLNGALEYLSHAMLGEDVQVTFFEIHGKKCYDLFNHRHLVHLRSDAEEQVHLRGAMTRDVHLQVADDFRSMMREALMLRASENTERNPISSRSHAVCTIKIANQGSLRLVDLAGSERNYETVNMSAAQHRESADINYTLMCLKDCFRAYHMLLESNTTSASTTSAFSQPRVPYRSSLLTRVLRDCFTSAQSHRTTIMATVSPSSLDVTHSINTLDHVTLMSPKLQSLISSVTVEIPKYIGLALSGVPIAQWTSEQVIAWFATTENGRFAHMAIPTGLDGVGLLQLDSNSFAALFAGDIRVARQEDEGSAWIIESDDHPEHASIAQALWAALRRENHSAVTLSANNEPASHTF